MHTVKKEHYPEAKYPYMCISIYKTTIYIYIYTYTQLIYIYIYTQLIYIYIYIYKK